MPAQRTITVELRAESHARIGTVWAWSLRAEGKELLGSRYVHRSRSGASLAAGIARARLLAGTEAPAQSSA